MNILITGAGGFIGKNLCAHLKAEGFTDLLIFDRQSDPAILDQYAAACDFVFHLAGVNRPSGDEGFEENHRFTRALLDSLKKGKKNPPVLMSSSVQAQLDNPYGLSKQKAEEAVLQYGLDTGADKHIFRLPGVFGKWCRPNYNSVVATFCHNVARGLPIRVDDTGATLSLVYIDDVLRAFTSVLRGETQRREGFYEVKPVYSMTVGKLRDTILSFRDARQNLFLPDMGDPLTRKLYSTYVSFLPEDAFSCTLQEHRDQRGTFAECLKSVVGGQVSVNITKPGMTKGGHWHHTKTEKIVVVCGSGLLRFRKPGDAQVLLYPVSSEKLEIVDIPPGYRHDMTNTGSGDMVMLIWASEIFNPNAPDTYPGAVSVEGTEP